MALVVEICQSFALDNGAYSFYQSGERCPDWSAYYQFAADAQRNPGCDFAVIPDSIDGTAEENDALLAAWPLGVVFGAPVWHMHEQVERLARLVRDYPRVCLGSSGQYRQRGTTLWWQRMDEAMRVACGSDGRPLAKLHGLGMLDPDIFTRLPFASADSTNIARNVGIDSAWRGTYGPPTKQARAQLMRARIEAHNAPARYDFPATSEPLWQLTDS